MKKSTLSRRNFISRAATAGAAGVIAAPALLNSCAPKIKEVAYNDSTLLNQAPDGPELKAALIGCGGRGTGAAQNFLDAGPHLKIIALADLFQDRLDECRNKLKKNKNQEIPDENCFLGFDAYEKVMDMKDVDLVILATPPYFRAQMFEAAVQARKHVFMEKPVAVDPTQARSIMSTAKKAEALELSVITGTQRRHQRDYIDLYKKTAGGMIGELTGGNVYWNGGKLWHKNPRPEWTEMEYMIRNWVNWCWLSGDHIVEQHVHNIDIANWFSGSHPVKALAFGSRQRRVTGDQYDNFSTDFVFENGIHIHSMCRQINGCGGGVYERLQYTEGAANCHWTNGHLTDLEGNVIYTYPYPLNDNGNRYLEVNPYVQEHIDLVTSIRNAKPINTAEDTAISTMTAIMGRISAYTGKEVTWDEMMNSDLKLGPKVFAFGPVDVPKEVPVPGKAWNAKS